MSHREKLRLARRMMSRVEVKAHASPFLSRAWEERKQARSDRVFKAISEINELQQKIMFFCGDWARKQKTPIPLAEVQKSLQAEGAKSYTITNAVNSLLRKKYIRRATVISNKSYFVMLRSA